MMKLIKNEIIKIFNYKLILIPLLFIASIFLIIYYNAEQTNETRIFETIYYVVPFVGLVVCLLLGGIMSSEFQNGTIRMYASKPVKRWKIIISKLITIYLVIIFLIIIVLASYIVFQTLLINIKAIQYPIWIIKKYLLYTIPVFFIGTFSLLLSTIFNSTAASVGVSCIIYLLGGLLSQILFGIEWNLVEYTFLPYLDFTMFIDTKALTIMNNELGINLNINNGIIILLINIVIMTILSILVFNKKDIKN